MSEKGEKVVPAVLGQAVEGTPEEHADAEGVLPGVPHRVIDNHGRREIFIPIERD